MSDTKLTPEDHVEISDGDTLIVSSKLCPLTEQESGLTYNKEDGIDIPCCMLDGNRCHHFFKIIISNLCRIQCSAMDMTKEVPDYKRFTLKQGKEKI